MEKKKDAYTQHLVSENKLQTQENQKTSENYSVLLMKELMRLIKEINKDNITVDSVNASCNAACEIHKILKLNFEMIKEGL